MYRFSMGTPLSSATSAKVRKVDRALTAALALLSGLLEPSCLAKILRTPANSSTVRTAPPAITPVPGAAGRMITLAPPPVPSIGWGMELDLVMGISMRCFLPSATPFLTAPITSEALPTPTPT